MKSEFPDLSAADDTPASPLARYWRETRQPLTCLLFVAPMLLVYEVGVLFLGPQSMRNGADVWLRQLLHVVGFGQYFLLPFLTCAMLLGWHYLRQDRWRVRLGILPVMFAEACGWGFLLLVVARFVGRLLPGALLATATPAQPSGFELFIGFFGAGIYEELLFRLMLLPAIYGLLRWVKVELTWSVVVAVVVSSLLFSLAHYRLVSEYGDPFELTSFLFRFLAGVFFAMVFVTRGFGIAAAAHTIYDILVGFII